MVSFFSALISVGTLWNCSGMPYTLLGGLSGSVVPILCCIRFTTMEMSRETFVCSFTLEMSCVDFCWVCDCLLPGLVHPFCGGLYLYRCWLGVCIFLWDCVMLVAFFVVLLLVESKWCVFFVC